MRAFLHALAAVHVHPGQHDRLGPADQGHAQILRHRDHHLPEVLCLRFFLRFEFDEDDNLICVGKSHWKGDLLTGYFDKNAGKMKTIIKLVYRCQWNYVVSRS